MRSTLLSARESRTFYRQRAQIRQDKEERNMTTTPTLTTPKVPTLADHEREAREQLATAGLELAPEAEDELIVAMTHARRRERHEARVAAARKLCAELSLELHVPAPMVATLALLGQGGPGNGGGPMAASQLPLLPAERIWRWQRGVGRAWVAALRAVAGRLVVTALRAPTPDGGRSEYEVELEVEAESGDPYRLVLRPSGVEDPELARAMARALRPGAEEVEGRLQVVDYRIQGLPVEVRRALQVCAARAFSRRAEELEREQRGRHC
jgi:hypothetical protein